MNTNQKTLFSPFSKLRLPAALLLLIVMQSCGSDATGNCMTTNTDFHQLYDETVALPNHQNTTDFATEIHEYSFTFSETKTICSIGYQSQSAAANVPYLIKIINNTTNTVVYNKSHIFSSDQTSYVSINPVVIKKNQSYTIRRTLLLSDVGGVNADLTGRVVTQNGGPIEFPKTFGLMTVTGSNFNHNGGTFVNTGIPFIDFAYY
jgi:uncharacterized membrane protein